MSTEDRSDLAHDHLFDQGSAAAERSTRLVLWITAAAMAVEIVAGWWFNSMALTADGWHMSSHALAIGLSVLAYATARRYASDPRFAFGTWKIEILGGFASAVFLLGVAAMMIVGSVERLLAPQAIQYREALAVACLGLAVNVACAVILGKAHVQGAARSRDGPSRGRRDPASRRRRPGRRQYRIADLHVWRVGRQVYSCAMTVVTDDPRLTPGDVRRRLAQHEEIVHSTIEMHVTAAAAPGAS